MLSDRKRLESPMSDKGPGGADARPEAGRKRKNNTHETIGRMLGNVYQPIENQPLPDNLLEILSRIPDPSADKDNS